MKCKIEDFQSLRQYIDWYIGKALNLPNLVDRINEAQLIVQTYYSDRSVVVEIKL